MRAQVMLGGEGGGVVLVFHPIYTWESSFVEEKCTLAVHVGFLPLHYLKEEKKTSRLEEKI